MSALTKEQFVEKARAKHNGKYNYDSFIYTNNLTKSVIVCPEHGEFLQSPRHHLYRGQGCPLCVSRKKSLEEFLEEAQSVHVNKYNYDKTIYVNTSTKTVITCPTHGDFEQTPNAHLQGHGCPKCGNLQKQISLKSSKDDFINKAIEIHNHKFTYEKVNYVNSRTKVVITCFAHGDFEQTPNAHLQGHSCKKCADENTSKRLLRSKSLFVEKAHKVHGNKYNYDKLVYVTAHTESIISCPKHGDFIQQPKNHLYGNGCPKCVDRFSTREDPILFLEKVKEIHGNKYNYDKTNYVNVRSEIIIECPQHGAFTQNAGSHAKGSGCPKCGVELIMESVRVSLEEFVNRSNEIHNYKYSYDKVSLKSTCEKIIIGCPKHGDFLQSAKSHLEGHGCHKCLFKNQTFVAEALDNLNLSYEAIRLRIDDMLVLPDFYVPDINMIIEYNGDQHYRPIQFGNMSAEQAQNKFIKQQDRDSKLKKYCQDNDIFFLEIDGRTIRGRKLVFEFITQYLGYL